MLKYPNDLNETLTDSITFAHSPYRPNNGQLFGSGGQASVPAEVSEMIRLYVPNSTPGMAQSNSWGRVNFEGELGQVRLNAIRAITNGISGLGGQGNLRKEIDRLGDIAGETFQQSLNSAVPALKQAGISFVAQANGLSGSQALAVTRGEVYNPNVELLYSSPQLRQFTFEFNFVPKNKSESSTIDDIIYEFKSYSAPKDPGGTEGVFCVPHIWNIVYSGLSAKKMAKFKPAALTNVTVQENSTSPTHTTFDDGTPVVTTMVLTFKEVNIITRNDHEAARGEGFRRGY